jgi:heterodisulfide reductase subunit B
MNSKNGSIQIEENISEEAITRIAYYPGCSLNSTAIDFNVSIKKLFRVLDIKLEEIEDWNCCGTTPAANISHEIPAALSARNLLLAKNMGFSEILSPCVSCYCKLFKAANILNDGDEEKSEYQLQKRKETLDLLSTMDFDQDEHFDFRIYSIVEILLKNIDLIKNKYQENKNRIKDIEKTILENTKPVCYYGCVLLRTEHITQFDSMENPTSMEKILEAVDIKSKDFSFKTECCGAILSLTHKNVVFKLSKIILDAALEAGANSIIVCCPLCQQNLDMRQSQINKHYKTSYRIPVYYISQILGLSMGLSYRDVMLDRLFVKPEIKKKVNMF